MTARDVLAQLRLSGGELWIDRATPEQLADALGALEGEAPYTYATRPRGGSKTLDGAGLTLAWLLAAPPGARGYLAAADRDQAGLALDSLRGFCDRSPELRARVEIERHRVIARDSGASIETLAADAASSWGLRPEWLVCDELGWWGDVPSSREFWESLSSAVAKSPTARMLVLTSPSDPGHFSFGVLQHARESDLWRTSEWTGLVPWLDPARVEEQRSRLPAPQFERLFMGRWVEGTDRLTSLGDVRACVTHEGTLAPDPAHRYVLGLDIGIKRDRTAAAIGHREGERVVIDALAVWRPRRLRPVAVDEVEAWCEQAAREYRAPVIADYWQSAQLTQRLRSRGLRVHDEHFTPAGNAKRAAVMAGLLRDHRLGLPNDDELIEELANLMLVEKSPGQYRLDHPPESTTIKRRRSRSSPPSWRTSPGTASPPRLGTTRGEPACPPE